MTKTKWTEIIAVSVLVSLLMFQLYRHDSELKRRQLWMDKIDEYVKRQLIDVSVQKKINDWGLRLHELNPQIDIPIPVIPDLN